MWKCPVFGSAIPQREVTCQPFFHFGLHALVASVTVAYQLFGLGVTFANNIRLSMGEYGRRVNLPRPAPPGSGNKRIVFQLWKK